jgi:[ribosomal protein S5]-alanine N-acetyltransferase
LLIRLDPIAEEHAPAVQLLASDPLIAATSNVPHPYPPDGALAWIRHTTAQRAIGRELNYAIVAEPGVVGVCGVMNIGGTPRSAELGYWIGVPYWGRGYATAAARELVRLVFEEHGLALLRSSCLLRNHASYRVLERSGFRCLGTGTHANTKWGPEDVFALFELTREEWITRATTGGRPYSV